MRQQNKIATVFISLHNKYTILGGRFPRRTGRFLSPACTLANLNYRFGEDLLTPLVPAAHGRGIEVFVDIQTLDREGNQPVLFRERRRLAGARGLYR